MLTCAIMLLNTDLHDPVSLIFEGNHHRFHWREEREKIISRHLVLMMHICLDELMFIVKHHFD